MSFPIDWTTAPDDDLANPFFPDVLGWTKVIKSSPASIVSTPGDGWDFEFIGVNPLVPWTNPSDASINDGVNSASMVTEWDSTLGGTFNNAAECLYASQWGFAIPLGATIKAVMVSINGVLYDIANTGFFPPGPIISFFPFALHVDAGWQYLGGLGSGNNLGNIQTGQKFSDGSWDGTPALVGTDKVNFTIDSSNDPPASGGLLPLLGASGITLTPAQVNDTNFGVGFTPIAVIPG